MSDISHIIDNIYLGNFESSNDVVLINKYSISAIVRILDLDMISTIKKEDVEPNISYYYISIYDHPAQKISGEFSGFLKFMKQNKKSNILIHCLMGISRSPTFTILYLVHKYKYSIIDAIKYVKKARPCVKPLKEFIYQVIEYSK